MQVPSLQPMPKFYIQSWVVVNPRKQVIADALWRFLSASEVIRAASDQKSDRYDHGHGHASLLQRTARVRCHRAAVLVEHWRVESLADWLLTELWLRQGANQWRSCWQRSARRVLRSSSADGRVVFRPRASVHVVYNAARTLNVESYASLASGHVTIMPSKAAEVNRYSSAVARYPSQGARLRGRCRRRLWVKGHSWLAQLPRSTIRLESQARPRQRRRR